MRSGPGHHAQSPRAGRSSGFSFRSILRNVSAGASSLASTVKAAGSSVATSISSAEEDRQREQVQWAGFDKLELGPDNVRRVLLLTYINGFQVWDVEEADEIWEIVSKRDGTVSFLRVLPQPLITCSDGGLDAVRPLLLVVTDEATTCRNAGIPVGGLANGYSSGVVGSPPLAAGNHFMPTVVKFYSLCSHTYVHTLRFRTSIHAVRCSPRVVAVALASQLYCFDAATLQSTFSVLTYPSPQPVNGLILGYGALAVGPRWLAYAANHPLMSNSGRISPQHLTPSPGVSPSTSPANGSLVAHYAKESSKQIVAGIVTLGDKGYKSFSRYCSEFFPEGSGSPVFGSPVRKAASNGHPPEADHAGIVIVRDFVTKAVVAQFRAHGSPLSALCFDPSGTLLVTASIQGHSINVFSVMPPSNGGGANINDANVSHVHLYKLNRGYTIGIIQDIAVSEDSHWVVVSTSKGTNHLFAISPFGGAVGPHTHGMTTADVMTPVPLLPWWSNMGPLKSSQLQLPLPPPPPTVNSSIVSRIKYGNGSWRETVSGAAAAASGRTSGLLGAVAVVFHDGNRKKLNDEEISSKEHLWVFFPSGHLIRYGIHLANGPDDIGMSTSEASDVKVVVKPLHFWDVSRRLNQVEREAKIDDSIAQKNLCLNHGDGKGVKSGLGNGPTGKEVLTSEELHQWFLSNAEVQMHHLRPPLWAKSQVSFHIFNEAVNAGLDEKDDYGGEVQIEKIHTRVMEVRKKDLVPVIDRLKCFQGREGVRNNSLNGMKYSNVHSQLLDYDSTQYGCVGRGAQGFHFHHSSSGSSCGSEGSSYSGPNGFNHLYQESCQVTPLGYPNDARERDVHVGGATFNSGKYPTDSCQTGPMGNSNDVQLCTPFHHPSQQNCFQSGKVQVHDLGFRHATSNTSLVGSPPMDIPHSDAFEKTARLREQPFPEEVILPPTGIRENESLNEENGSEHQKIGTESGRATDKSVRSLCSSGLNQVSGRAYNDLMTGVGKFDLQEEDADSTDATNSKSEDFGGEPGEDGWEGTMFPFAED